MLVNVCIYQKVAYESAAAKTFIDFDLLAVSDRGTDVLDHAFNWKSA